MSKKTIVYLVKFDMGYYAAKQPNYHWSYTDDPMLALRYKTPKAAKERGEWGVGLAGSTTRSAVQLPASYDLETYSVEEILTKM